MLFVKGPTDHEPNRSPTFLASIVGSQSHDSKRQHTVDVPMTLLDTTTFLENDLHARIGDSLVRPRAPLTTTTAYPLDHGPQQSMTTSLSGYSADIPSPPIATSQSYSMRPPVIPAVGAPSHDTSCSSSTAPTSTPNEDVLAPFRPSATNQVVRSIPVAHHHPSRVSWDPALSNLAAPSSSSFQCSIPQDFPCYTSAALPPATASTVSPGVIPIADPGSAYMSPPHPHQVLQLNMLSLVAIQRAKLVHYDATGTLFPGSDHARPAIVRISPRSLARPDLFLIGSVRGAASQRGVGTNGVAPSKPDGMKAMEKTTRPWRRDKSSAHQPRLSRISSHVKIPTKA
jgi:hypothetical protein